jgi:hypothetical protein
MRDARVFLASPWSRRRLTMGSYSMDLRERLAAAIDEGEGSERQIAKRFRVSVSFCTRLLQRRRDAGTLAPKPYGGGPRPVLGFPEQVRLAMLIAEHPDATLNQWARSQEGVGPATSGRLKKADSPRNLIVLLCAPDVDLTDLLETACLVSRSIDITS